MDININLCMKIQNYVMLLNFILGISSNGLFKKINYEIVFRTIFILKYKNLVQGIV